MNKSHTRSAVRRAGDDYQDIVAIEIAVQMLERPSEFDYMRIEADDEGKSIDDVIIKRSDNSFNFYQIKYTLNEQLECDWDYFLDHESPKSTSRLYKWFKSWKYIKESHKRSAACLWTNRKSSLSVNKCLIGNKISFALISDEIKSSIREQIADPAIAEFFEEFQFEFRRPNLEIIESDVIDRLRMLNVSERGLDALYRKVREWVRNGGPAPNGCIRLHHIRQTLSWHDLHGLAQDFEVPSDFVLPSKVFHDCVIQDIESRSQAVIILKASPGQGKSTYLSHLTDELRSRKIPVIRHHYFLSLSDKSGDRFSSNSVMESLMHGIMLDFSDAIGMHSRLNPSPHAFADWLKSCGKYFSSKGSRLVIIIDGLDHIYRESRNVDELNKLFDSLLPVENGIFLIVGTQPLPKDKLPLKLAQLATDDDFVELPLFTKHEIDVWLSKHQTELRTEQANLQNITDAFFEVSQGHPLILKYSLSFLVNGGMEITSSEILKLTKCNNADISKYYEQLWRSLGEHERMIVCLLAVSQFDWEESDILDCLQSSLADRAVFQKALQSTKHLMKYGYIGLTAFHGSLFVFVRTNRDFINNANALRLRILGWLRSTTNHKYLRWANEWILEADSGNPNLLINGPSREWAVEGIASGYPKFDGLQILQKAGEAALKEKNIPQFIYLGLLKDYYGYAYEYQGDGMYEIFEPQLHAAANSIDQKIIIKHFKSLHPKQLLILSRFGALSNRPDLCDFAFAEANERIRHQENRINELFEIVCRCGALAPKITSKRIFDYVKSNRKVGNGSVVLAHTCSELFHSKNLVKLDGILEFKNELTRPELYVVIHWWVLSLLDIKSIPNRDMQDVNHPMLAIYYKLAMHETKEIKSMFPDVSILESSRQNIFDRQALWVKFFCDSFFSILANSIYGDFNENIRWLKGCQGFGWPSELLNILNARANVIAKCMISQEELQFAILYDQFRIHIDKTIQHFEKISQKQITKNALLQLSFDLCLIARSVNKNVAISQTDLETIFNSGYCTESDFLGTYLEHGRPLLSQKALDFLVERITTCVMDQELVFNERSLIFARLARLKVIHDQIDASSFVKSAAENLVSYGYHKDIFYFQVIETLINCHHLGGVNITNQLKQLLSPFCFVELYTDGDETDYLPQEIIKAFFETAPLFVESLYLWFISEERYKEADYLFHEWLERTDLDSRVAISLAATGIDDKSLKIIVDKESTGNSKWGSVVRKITDAIGPIRLIHSVKDQTEIAKPSINQTRSAEPKEYPPARFSEYLNIEKDGLFDWFDYWGQSDQFRSAIQAVLPFVESAYDESLVQKILDVTWERGTEDEKYYWLTKFHIKLNGWDKYFNSEDKALESWEKVKGLSTKNCLQFVQDTCISPYEEGISVTAVTKCYRLAKYFLLMGQYEIANKIAKILVSFGNELVSAIRLPIIELTESISSEDAIIGMLLLRLQDRSLFVRERASCEISKLLLEDELNQKVNNKLLSLLKKCHLESQTTNLLLIWIKARQLRRDCIIPTETEITQSSAPSIVFSSLLKVLFPKTSYKTSPKHSGKTPDEFISSNGFDNLCDSYLPPVFRTEIEDLQDELSITLKRQWEWESQSLQASLNMENLKDVRHYSGREDGLHFICGYKLSEIIQSAYLRTLSFALDKKEVMADKLIQSGLKSVPVNIEFWKKELNQPPSWYLDLETIVGSDSDLFGQLEHLWDRQSGRYIIAEASFLMDFNNQTINVEIFGFLQRSHGPVQPNVEVVLSWARWDVQVRLQNRKGHEIQGEIRPIKNRMENRCDDWGVLPICGQLAPSAFSRWQWWRMFRGIWTPYPILISEPTRVEISTDSLEYQNTTGIIGKWIDWGTGVHDYLDSNLPPATGQCLEIDRSLVNQVCDRLGYQYCWLVRVTDYTKEPLARSYRETKASRYFGSTSIIRPE